MFSDETIIRQFLKIGVRVRRPVGKRYNLKYVRPSVKHLLQIMIWGSISAKGGAGLHFLPPGKNDELGSLFERADGEASNEYENSFLSLFPT